MTFLIKNSCSYLPVWRSDHTMFSSCSINFIFIKIPVSKELIAQYFIVKHVYVYISLCHTTRVISGLCLTTHMKKSCLLQRPWHHIKHTQSSPSSHKTDLSAPLFCFWLHSSFHNRDLLSYFPFPFFLPQCQAHTCKNIADLSVNIECTSCKCHQFRRSLAFFTLCFHKIGVQQQSFLMSQMNDQETSKDGRKSPRRM